MEKMTNDKTTHKIMRNDTISEELLNKYFSITGEALLMAKGAEKPKKKEAEICLDMAERYINDARHFREQGKVVLAYGCLNYAHGWLDCGAMLKFFLVDDDRLFTVDR
jgi:hypothetical protein